MLQTIKKIKGFAKQLNKGFSMRLVMITEEGHQFFGYKKFLNLTDSVKFISKLHQDITELNKKKGEKFTNDDLETYKSFFSLMDPEDFKNVLVNGNYPEKIYIDKMIAIGNKKEFPLFINKELEKKLKKINVEKIIKKV